MQNAHHVWEFLGPTFARRPVPIQVFRLLQNADIHFVRGDEGNDIAHAIDRIFHWDIPGLVPTDSQIVGRLGHGGCVT